MSNHDGYLSAFQISNLFSVEGLTAVVTGGGSGLGLYAAQALACNGALVYILGRRQEALDQASQNFAQHLRPARGSFEGEIVGVSADITSKTSLAEAKQKIEEDLRKRNKQGIQVLVCNAGIGGKFLRSYGSEGASSSATQSGKDDKFSEIVNELLSFSETDINSILQTNVTGNYLTCLIFLDLLKKGSSSTYASQTIIISSNAAWAKLPILNPIYNISKTAVSQLAKILSTMFCDYNLRTNLIEPGLYPSDLTSTEPKNTQTGHSNLSHTNGADIPIGRCGKPEEHAAAILYLANRSNQFANGATLRIDGGALQRVRYNLLFEDPSTTSNYF